MIDRIKKLLAYTSSERFVDYLNKKGLSVGENTHFISPIRSNIDIGRAEFIKIGNNCIICSGVTIVAHDYSWSILRKSHFDILPSGGGEVVVGNNCFIGVNSTLLRNVKIGDNVIVAAGSVVSKSIESNVVVGGNPAKVLMSLDDYYKRRKEMIIEEARQNILITINSKGRLPKISEMGDFSVLFLPRNDENIKKYVSKRRIGDTAQEFNTVFMNIKPIFNDFDSFLKDVLGEEIYIKYKNL